MLISPWSEIEIKFTVDNPYPTGPVLFHCHQQLHLDHGFAINLEYAQTRRI